MKKLTKARAQRIVRENLPWLRWAMQLQDWSIDVKWDWLEKRSEHAAVAGEVDARPDYRFATIVMDHRQATDKARLLHNLRHELLHLVLSPFITGCYIAQVAAPLDAAPAIDAAFTTATEQAILQIERALDLLGMTAEGMIAAAKKEAKSWRPVMEAGR